MKDWETEDDKRGSWTMPLEATILGALVLIGLASVAAWAFS